jgi:hypothetical protein
MLSKASYEVLKNEVKSRNAIYQANSLVSTIRSFHNRINGRASVRSVSRAVAGGGNCCSVAMDISRVDRRYKYRGGLVRYFVSEAGS